MKTVVACASLITIMTLPALCQGFGQPLVMPSTATAPTLQQKLIHAVIQDQADQVAKLLSQGGDPNARSWFAPEDQSLIGDQSDEDQAPPLFVLACRYQSVNGPVIIRMLLDKGANVNITDKNGVTPLMAASMLGGAVPTLLGHKPNVNAADKNGWTALMYAMNNRGFSTVANLLNYGANINARDIYGQTALLQAITGARIDTIRLYGEDQKTKAETEMAAYLQLIQLLINSHADVKARDKAGNTPLKLALAQKEIEVVKMLRKAGATR